MGKTFGAPRGTWAAVGVVVLGGCSTILGIDNDYGPAEGNESGSSDSATSSSGTGGASSAAMSSSGTGGGCGTATTSSGTGGSATGACVPSCSGKLGFVLATTMNVGKKPAAVTIADFDGDGVLDLATANSDGQNVSFLHGKGKGTFDTAVNTPVIGYPVAMVAADLDGDTKMDLAIANLTMGTVTVLWGNGDGVFQDPPSSYPTGTTSDTSPAAVAAVDVDGDGHLDLVVANSGTDTVSVLLGLGNHQFAKTAGPTEDMHPNSLVALDLDGDGRTDIASASGNSSSVSVLHGDGKGAFVNVNHFDSVITPSAITARDLNNDGKPDLIVANSIQDASFDPPKNTVTVLFNKGNNTFGPKVLLEVGTGMDTGPTAVVAADLDGDGKPDLAVTGWYSNTVTVLHHTDVGQGDDIKAFVLTSTTKTGTEPDSIATADLDGDGWPDLVTANALDNTVSILLNTCPD